MPELPEVETVRRTLERRIVGDTIDHVLVPFPGCIENGTVDTFRKGVERRSIRAVRRRAKYLIVSLDDGSAVVIHLRMTGRLTWGEGGLKGDGVYVRMALTLRSGRTLYFEDPRKFGRVGWYPDERSLDRRIRVGPDPTEKAFTVEMLTGILHDRRRPIKSLLLDQTVIGGLGNIYADESLFRAAVAPTRPAGSLDEGEILRLWQTIREVLDEGVRFKGASVRDYVDGDGRSGTFQERLAVYGREGRPCTRCGGPIERLKLGGRSSYHCPRCQS